MLALAGNTLLLEPGPHADHPVLGTADVVLCLLAVEVEKVLLLEAGEVDLALKVKGVAVLGVLEEDLGRHVFALLGSLEDVRHEAGRAGVTSTVDPGDGSRGSLGGEDGVVDGDEGSSTDTSRDENQGLLGGGGIGRVDKELSAGRAQLDLVTDVVALVQAVRDKTGDLASGQVLDGGLLGGTLELDAHAEVVAARGLAETELSALEEAVELRDGNLQADVLAREELGQRLAIEGLKIEAGDGVVLGLLLDNLELAPRVPLSSSLVKITFSLDKDVCQLTVGGDPSLLDLGGQGRAENLTNGTDEMRADNLILLRLDEERDVLLSDTLNSMRQLAEVVDVGGVGEDRVGEGGLLSTRLLVTQREVVLELGVGAEHVAVEGGGDGLAVLLEDGSRRLDDGDLSLCESHCDGVCS